MLPTEIVGATLVSRLAAKITTIDAELVELDQMITGRFNEHKNAEIIQSMPGFGPILAATFLANVGGDLRAFESADRLASVAGVAPLPGTRDASAATITDPAAFQRYAAAQNQLSGVLGRLMVIQEQYPDLKSNQNFLVLQSQLEGTENRIGIARRDYNEAVRDFNTSLRTFPTVIWAKTFYSGTKPMVLFSASESAQTAPTVSFDIAPPGGTAPAVAPGSTSPAPAAMPSPAPATVQ